MAYAHLRTNETRAISRRREREDRRLLMSATVGYHFSLQSHAEWEEKTNKKMAATAVKTIRRGMELEYAANLERRRERLRQLLTQDDEKFRDEIASLQESSADRARRLIHNARALKADRERKRQEQVAEALDRQWKLSCDDLRTIDSEYFNVFCKEKILRQIDEKKAARQTISAEEAQWAAAWEADRLAKVKAEEEKASRRRADIAENRAALRAQVEEREVAQQAEQRAAENEKEAFNLLLQSQADALRGKQAVEHQRKRELCKQVVTYNEALQSWRRAEERRRKDEEKRWIDEKQREYEADTEAERSDQEAQKRDMREYLAYLQAKKQDDARMESVMDALIAQQVAAENMKKDLSSQKEQLAREKLMREVFDTRERQLGEKAQRRALAEEERQLEKRAHELELEKVRAHEADELDAERREKERRKAELEAQMETLRMRQKLEELSRLREKESAFQQEREYRDRLERAKRNTVETAKRNYGVKSTLGHHLDALKTQPPPPPHALSSSAGRMSF